MKKGISTQILALIVLSVFFFGNTASAQTTTGTSTEETEEVQERDEDTEELRGKVEGVGDTLLTLRVKDENETESRRIRIGNRTAIKVTRDGKEASLEDIFPGDAAIVRYTTNARYEGVVRTSGTQGVLAMTTTDGRDLSFVGGPDLEIKFDYDRNSERLIRATVVGSGTIPVIAELTPGTNVEVAVKGESIVEIEAFSNGRLPSNGGWILPLLVLLIVAVLFVLYRIKRKRN